MAVTFDLTNFVINRPLRGLMVSKSVNSVLWSIKQITNPSLSVTTESTDAVDALGAKIMTFDRAKNAEFSAENSLFDLGLAAAQAGNDKEIATTEKKIVVPIFDELEVTAEATITLKHTPTQQITTMYVLNGDSTLGKKFTNGAEASADNFVHAEKTNTIKVPTGLEAGTRLFVMYEYESEAAVAVHNDAINFPKTGVFYLEVLGADICNPEKLIHAYVKFENAKLVADVDMTFTTEGTHNFKIEAMQNYCDKNKRLFSIIVPDEE